MTALLFMIRNWRPFAIAGLIVALAIAAYLIVSRHDDGVRHEQEVRVQLDEMAGTISQVKEANNAAQEVRHNASAAYYECVRDSRTRENC